MYKKSISQEKIKEKIFDLINFDMMLQESPLKFQIGFIIKDADCYFFDNYFILFFFSFLKGTSEKYF